MAEQFSPLFDAGIVRYCLEVLTAVENVWKDVFSTYQPVVTIYWGTLRLRTLSSSLHLWCSLQLCFDPVLRSELLECLRMPSSFFFLAVSLTQLSGATIEVKPVAVLKLAAVLLEEPGNIWRLPPFGPGVILALMCSSASLTASILGHEMKYDIQLRRYWKKLLL